MYHPLNNKGNDCSEAQLICLDFNRRKVTGTAMECEQSRKAGCNEAREKTESGNLFVRLKNRDTCR